MKLNIFPTIDEFLENYYVSTVLIKEEFEECSIVHTMTRFFSVFPAATKTLNILQIYQKIHQKIFL